MPQLSPQVGPWSEVLTLGADRSVVAGSDSALRRAIGRGADLRIGTTFVHNEHLDPRSDCAERIHEVAEFRCTYLLDDRWVAGIMTLRQPIAVPDGFGPRPSMSFFLYNQNGQQAIARPFLDGGAVRAEPGSCAVDDHADMPKYHEEDNWDAGTNAPSSNFVYEFGTYRFFVRDDWREVLSHDESGAVISGTVEVLGDALWQGREVKVAVRGLCAAWSTGPQRSLAHEVFIQAGSCYYYTERKLFLAGTHPVVRLRPDIPLRYSTRGWDFGWLMVRSDGRVEQLLYDPYTLKVRRQDGRFSLRWFVR